MEENNNAEPTQQPPSAGEESNQAAPEIPTSGAADFTQQFAALSRQERELHLKQREFAAKEQKFAEMEKRMAEYEQRMALANESPEKFLEANGISVKELLTRELNGGETPESEVLRKQLEAQAQQIEDLRQSQAAKERAAEDARLQQLKSSYVDQIKNWVDNTDGEQFELVKASNAYETVYQVLQQEYNASGRDLGFQNACEVVEDYYRKELERYRDTRVLKELSGGSSEPMQKESASSPAASEQRPRTTKTLENVPVAQPAEPSRPLTREERLAKFAESVRWT